MREVSKAISFKSMCGVMGGKKGVGMVIVVMVVMVMSSVKGAPEEDVVERLPGQPRVGFKQYGGYVTVDEEAGRALFYYLVEARKHAGTKPLTLWLNGGPGCSSVGNGAFEEIGPFRPHASGRALLLNKYSWNQESNLLFVESPAGVGFSYSNTTLDYSTNDTKTAKDLLLFLLGWFQKFPEYQDRDLFLTGESYAGHYIPQLASLLLQYNRHPGHFSFQLKGIAIGNPLLSYATDSFAGYHYWWSHGMISDDTFEGIKNSCDFDDYEITSINHNVTSSCNLYINRSNDEVGDFINEYDVIVDICYPAIAEQELRLGKLVQNRSLGVDVCLDNECEFYMNLQEVQEALHANTTSLSYNWTLCSSVLNYTYDDFTEDMLSYLEMILRNGLRVWIYSGDLDSVIPLIGTRSLMRDLASSLQLKTEEAYRAWYSKGQVAGWTVIYQNLTYATIRGAGHMAPLTQPSRSLLLFQSFLRDRPLPPHPT